MIRLAHHALLRLAATALCCACGSPDAQSRPSERTFTASSWHILWQAGGSEADTTVLMPSQVLADGEHVYVLEGPLRRITAFGLMDGTPKWALGGAGSGPDEFKGISSFDVDRSGNLLVMDAGNGRIAVVTPDGAVERHIRVPDSGFQHGICAFADGRMVLAILAGERPLAIISPEGRVERRLELPWRDARRQNSLAVQGRLASVPGSQECIYALSYGRGFVRVAMDGRSSGHPYAEEIDLPESRREQAGNTTTERLGERTEAMRALAVDTGGIAIGFAGTTEDAGRLIDLHDPSTGAYQASLRAPFFFERMTRVGNTYVFITRVDGYPAVVAAELRAPSP